MKKLIFIFIIFFLVLTPVIVTAYTMEVDYPVISGVQPTTGLVDYIRYVYLFALGTVGLVAFGVMVYGGILYMMSGTSITSQDEAKKWFKAAISGLLLALASYLILNTINPNLVKIKAPTLPVTRIPTAPATPTSLSTLGLGDSCNNTSLTCDGSQNLICQGGICVQAPAASSLPTTPSASPSTPGYFWEERTLCQGTVPGSVDKRYYCAASSFCSLADRPTTGDYCCCSTRDRSGVPTTPYTPSTGTQNTYSCSYICPTTLEGVGSSNSPDCASCENYALTECNKDCDTQCKVDQVCIPNTTPKVTP